MVFFKSREKSRDFYLKIGECVTVFLKQKQNFHLDNHFSPHTNLIVEIVFSEVTGNEIKSLLLNLLLFVILQLLIKMNKKLTDNLL